MEAEAGLARLVLQVPLGLLASTVASVLPVLMGTPARMVLLARLGPPDQLDLQALLAVKVRSVPPVRLENRATLVILALQVPLGVSGLQARLGQLERRELQVRLDLAGMTVNLESLVLRAGVALMGQLALLVPMGVPALLERTEREVGTNATRPPRSGLPATTTTPRGDR